MKRKKIKTAVWVLLAALITMLFPVSEADAAASASDFRIEGSTLVKYRGTEKNVSVPDTVTTIGRSAFEDDKNIELVVLPNSVKNIEPYAFWGCDNLDTVVLGKEIASIGDYAFAGCKGLVQMTVPASVTSIGIQAFGDCANLADITIPRQTADIHETAFVGCIRLTIHCDPGSAAEKYAEDFYERQKNMPGYGEALEEPLPPEETDGDAPSTPAPQPTETPEELLGALLGSTRVVGNHAVILADNRQLQVLGGRQETEGEETEEPDSFSAPSKFCIVDGALVADQAYYRSDKLGDVSLPEGIKEIGQFGYARSSLTSVVLPEGTEKIGYGAFYHCDRLESVTMPDTVVCVEPKAFEHSKWVEDFLQGDAGEGDFLVEGGVLAAYRGKQAEVKIPQGVRVIAGEVFRGHEEIESLFLPDSLLVIGEGAFEGCSNLDKIVFGNKVEEIKDRAFRGSALKEITVPASVKRLGIMAFGDALITYEGREAEYVYEESATRLANGDYRIYRNTEEETAGVTVSGMEGVSASLKEADRGYALEVTLPEDVSAMENAFQRCYSAGIPEDMTVFGLTLTDASGIPLTKLGTQSLTVEFPVPEELRGQSLRLFAVDRNGQLEVLASEETSAEGVETLRFTVNQLYLFGICGADE